MAYKTYITEALVCGAFDNNTADRSFLLFTREAGMLYASAKSVRKEESKHRYALQECSLLRATLVRGKTGWRITGTEPIANLYATATTREARRLLRNVIVLLKRVLHGETSHQDIFDDMRTVCTQSEGYPEDILEHLFTLRTLDRLGYVPPSSTYNAFLSPGFPHSLIGEVTEEAKRGIKKVCEEALHASQL